MGVFGGLIGVLYGIFLLALPFIIWSLFKRLKRIERRQNAAPKSNDGFNETVVGLLDRLDRLEGLIGSDGAKVSQRSAFPSQEKDEAPQATQPISSAPPAAKVSINVLPGFEGDGSAFSSDSIEGAVIAASATNNKCPECGATLIVDASADYSTCAWCGTNIPNVLAKESDIPTEEIRRYGSFLPLPVIPQPASHQMDPAENRFPAEFPEPAHKPESQEEWEEVLGGNWLNKLGVVVLVIGVALFLGYSFTYFGPVGRVEIGLATSFAMLFVGILLERSPAYVFYARGMIGGGWAALYFTTYAMHGLEAARIITDPLLGIILLGTVAVGMITHSLRYRSEVVTGLAYFLAFFTLGISPVSGFSLFALMPLAASLLVVAYRFSWATMTLMGLIATYSIYFLFSSIVFPTPPFQGDFQTCQAVLVVYWLQFEIFDLLDIRKHPSKTSIARAILPLNAVGFTGISLLHWMATGRKDLYLLFAATAVAYLVSALLRARIQPPSTAFTKESSTTDRMSAGSYEGAITIAATLAALAIFDRFSGMDIGVFLLLEGEALFLAGLTLRQPYLRLLGAAIFAITLYKLVWEALGQTSHKTIAGVEIHIWTPVAVLTAALLYLNRGLFHPDREPRLLVPENGYSFAATGILLAVLAAELPQEYLGIGWLILAVPLFELGMHRRFAELRFQAYGVGFLAFVFLAGINILGAAAKMVDSPWLTLGLAALLTYAVGARTFHTIPERLPEDERLVVRDLCLATGTILLAALLWNVLPTPLVAVAWGIEALALIELGLLLRLPSLRAQGNLVLGLAFGRLFLANFTITGETAGISHRILTVTPFVFLFHYVSVQLRAETGSMTIWERPLGRLYFYAPALLAAILIRFEFGRTLVVVGWAILGLTLLYFGLCKNNRDLRWQSYILAAATFSRCWATNFYIPESLAGLSERLFVGAVVIMSLYAAQFLSPRHPEDAQLADQGLKRWLGWIDLNARSAFAVLASVLLAALLYYEISARFLTIAWALEGVTLLIISILVGERALRLQGYVLAVVTFFRCWAIDFYIHESFTGLSLRLVIGAVVIASLYVFHFLSPRHSGKAQLADQEFQSWIDWFEANARLVFAVLASVLLAALLYYEISARFLTIAWALEGVILLAVGFPARERTLRLSGLALLMACIVKVFAYDLRELETLFRILSFIVLGLLLLGVSLIYTRYKDQLRRYF